MLACKGYMEPLNSIQTLPFWRGVACMVSCGCAKDIFTYKVSICEGFHLVLYK